MCGIPYYLGGMVEPENLPAYPPTTFREKRGIDLRLHTRVTGVDAARCALAASARRGVASR
jgi:NADPH-dependent 2,4-dienoyl-CoA reductase/sulfur reductase-like enzyme